MKTTVNGLIREAARSATFNGHKLRLWYRYEASADTTCKRCPAGVQVLVKPLPNQISIGGEAVSTRCGGIGA